MKQTVELADTLVLLVNYVVAENAYLYKRMKPTAELADTLVNSESYVALVFVHRQEVSEIADLAETLVVMQLEQTPVALEFV